VVARIGDFVECFQELVPLLCTFSFFHINRRLFCQSYDRFGDAALLLELEMLLESIKGEIQVAVIDEAFFECEKEESEFEKNNFFDNIPGGVTST
jgi:hypothetical protein